MKRKIVTAIIGISQITIATAQQACHEQQFITASNEAIEWVGRIDIKNDYADFTFPGVQLNTIFTGSTLQMLTKANSGYFVVEIDNRPPFKVHSTETDSLLMLASNLSKGKHQARITLATEGNELHPRIYGIIIDRNAKVLKTELPKRKIEFIGNSITCGYGNEAANEHCPFSYDNENHWSTYAAITARLLDAQCQIVARSGIGIYRHYGAPRQGTDYNMPRTYEYTQFGQTGERWDFKRFTPDVVCLNLGTNDTSLDNYDTTLLVNAYINFIKNLREHYPTAKIVLLTGTMMNGKALDDVKSALDETQQAAQKRGDNEVYRFDMSPINPAVEGYGGSYHPSALSHMRMADELSTYLRKLMKW